MTWFTSTSETFEARQWPEVGLMELSEFVGAHRVIVAKDGTVYVIVSSGHPQRLERGWFVCRYPGGSIGVVAEDYRAGWEETEAPQ